MSNERESSTVSTRLLDRKAAAAYVGLSTTNFDVEVAAGTFPQPFPLALTRRRLWDVRALDAAIDRAMGIQAKADNRAERKRAWQEERERRENRRPWAARERREREEKLAKRKGAEK
jgi:predicted DNA-binding transcriptional regulator AlpA